MLKRIFTITTLMLMLPLAIISAKNMHSIHGKTNALFNRDIKYGTMKDLDGNVYKTVTIGNQTWMAENLHTTTYNDGTPISHPVDSMAWCTTKSGAYCTYNNFTNADSIATYGFLYNQIAVNTGKLAPKGWHVPSKEECDSLISYLGGDSVAGYKMLEVGSSHWKNSYMNDFDVTNESGLTVLPGGSRDADATFKGMFINFDTEVGFWTTSPSGDLRGWTMFVFNLFSVSCSMSPYSYILDGHYVRCIKDK